MNSGNDRTIRLCILLMGHSVKELEFPAKDCVTVKQFLLENYAGIFPWEAPTEADGLFRWESFTRDNIEWFKRYLPFHFVAGDSSDKTTIHLIDNLDSRKITVSNSGIYHNDTIWFYLQENLRETVELIAQAQDSDFVLELLGAIERLLTTADAQILLDNFALFKARSLTEHFTKNLIPSTTWRQLNHPKLTYYKQFLVSLANQLLLLDHCLNRDEPQPTTITQSNKEEWLHHLLYRIHTQMLTLLSVPEAFVRNIYPMACNFSEGLQKCGVIKLPQKDDDYYDAHIANRSISDVYQPFFASLEINDYFEFIRRCTVSPLFSPEIATICQTFRILFNKLKHAAYIEVIRSRDADAIRQAELSGIESEIQQLESGRALGPLERQARIRRLSIKKEVVEKVRHMHEFIDFDAPDFTKRNGIRVFSPAGKWYTIGIADLELSFKVLVGILTILQRCASTPTVP